MKKTLLVLTVLLTCQYGFSQNVGIGIPNPSDKLHVNSLPGFDPLRVDINNIAKLRVWANGGTSIGNSTLPPADGLLVKGTLQPQNNISTPNKMYIESTADSIVVNAGGSRVIIAANGNITIESGGLSTLTVKSGGNLTVEAGAILTLKGSSVNLQSNSNITMTAGLNFTQNAGGNMNINGTMVRFNNGARPVARLSDTVNGAIITSGSSTVFSQ